MVILDFVIAPRSKLLPHTAACGQFHASEFLSLLVADDDPDPQPGLSMNRPTFLQTCMWKTGYDYLAQSAAKISRNALASGFCGDYRNRGLAPNAICFRNLLPEQPARHGIC